MNSIFTSIRNISIHGIFSYDVYKVKSGGAEGKHYHKFLEIVHVIKGNCKTHKQGHLYFYRKGQIHEFINDSRDELIIGVLTIPPETIENTIYINSNISY